MTKVVISKSMTKIIEYLMENEYLMFNPKTKEHCLFLHEKEEKDEEEDMQELSRIINKYL